MWNTRGSHLPINFMEDVSISITARVNSWYQHSYNIILHMLLHTLIYVRSRLHELIFEGSKVVMDTALDTSTTYTRISILFIHVHFSILRQQDTAPYVCTPLPLPNTTKKGTTYEIDRSLPFKLVLNTMPYTATSTLCLLQSTTSFVVPKFYAVTVQSLSEHAISDRQEVHC